MKTNIKELFEGPGFAEEYLAAKIQSKLQEMLDERGLSRTDLARRMNVSKARVSQIFSDDANFTVKTLARACHALHCDAWRLFADVATEVKSASTEFRESPAQPSLTTGPLDRDHSWLDTRMAYPAAWNLEEFVTSGQEPAQTRPSKQRHASVGAMGLSAANDWSTPVELKKSLLLWN